MPIDLKNNGYKIYVDFMTGENFCQFRLLTWNFIRGDWVAGLNPSFTLLENMNI